MNVAGSAAIVILAVLVLAACPPLIYTLAENIEGAARLVVRILRAHADASMEYPASFRRHYQRRAES